MIRSVLVAFTAGVGFAAASAETPKCVPVAEALAALKARVPAEWKIGTAPAADVPAIKAWLESESLPGGDGEGYFSAHKPGLAILFPVREGQVCEGQCPVIQGRQLADLIALLERWQLRRGIVPARPERGA